MSNQHKGTPPPLPATPSPQGLVFHFCCFRVTALVLAKALQLRTIALASWFLTLLAEKCSGHLAFPRPPVTIASVQTSAIVLNPAPLPPKRNKPETTLLEELVIGKG